MRAILAGVLASLFAGLAAPPAYIAAEAIFQAEPLVAEDLEFAYTMVAPFTLLAAFVLAWPSYRLQPEKKPAVRRLLIAIAICFVAGTAMMMPLADTLPWKAGMAAAATLILWVGAHRAFSAMLSASSGTQIRYAARSGKHSEG